MDQNLTMALWLGAAEEIDPISKEGWYHETLIRGDRLTGEGLWFALFWEVEIRYRVSDIIYTLGRGFVKELPIVRLKQV